MNIVNLWYFNHCPSFYIYSSIYIYLLITLYFLLCTECNIKVYKSLMFSPSFKWGKLSTEMISYIYIYWDFFNKVKFSIYSVIYVELSEWRDSTSSEICKSEFFYLFITYVLNLPFSVKRYIFVLSYNLYLQIEMR